MVSRDTPLGEPRLEGHVGGHLQSPQAALMPELLGERWSIPRSRSADCASKLRTRASNRGAGVSASMPLSLKARMALRTVCEAHPRLRLSWAARGRRRWREGSGSGASRGFP